MAAGTRATAVPVYVGQLVQNGSITTPVQFFDIGLPSGYSRFNFYFTGMTVTASGMSTGDNIAAALQLNGGFVCDNINNDSYYDMNTATTASLMTLTPPQTDIAHGPDFRAVGLIDIYPGDANNWPLLTVTYSWAQPSGGLLVLQGLTGWIVNPGSTTGPASPAPAAMLRVLPLGLGDCNPPTSGETINTGDWRLYAFN